MEIAKSIFREYDIRGVYPDQVNENAISLIAKAIAIKCDQENVEKYALVETEDCRRISPQIIRKISFLLWNQYTKYWFSYNSTTLLCSKKK